MKRTRRLLPAMGALAAALAWAPAARAQLCDPSVEICEANPPTTGIWPETQHTDSTELMVRVSWFDADGVAGSTRRILVNGSSVGWPVVASTATSGFAEGRVQTRADALNAPTIVIAEITDAQGAFHADTAIYTWNAPPPPPPPGTRAPLSVSLAPFHNGFRSVATGSSSLSYAMPAYVSMGQPRSYGAVYLSGQAYPQGFVQVDVTDPNTDPAPVYSLRILNDQGAAVTLHNGQTEMYFSRPPSGAARLAAQWDMRPLGTGAYKYQVVVTGHWSGGSSAAATADVRVLNIDERESPFGRGWSMPGWHRTFESIHGDGVMITHGDGTAMFFERPATCTGNPCTYRSPEGDLSTLTRLDNPERYERVYRDGSKVTYRGGAIYTVHDRFGNRTSYDMGSSNGRIYPTGITDPAGQVVQFNRVSTSQCSGCRIVGMVDPAGRTTVISHDAAGNVSQVVAPDNSYVFRGATYTANSMLTQWTDTRGGAWDIFYYRNFLQRVQAPPGTTGAVRAVTGFRSLQVAAMRFNTATSFAAPAPWLSPDSVLVKITDPGNHSTLTRLDRLGNVTWTRSHTGLVTDAHYNPVTGQLSYHSDGANTTEYHHDSTGDLRTVVQNGQEVYSATYAAFGQPRSVTQGGRTTWFSYDSAGVPVRSWTGGQADADSLSKATSYVFDARGRPTRVTTPDGLIYETFYLAAASMNVEATRERKLVADSTMWVATYYGYDGLGRPWWSESPDGVTRMEHDALNRPTKVTDPANGITTYAYTGPDLTSVTDPSGKVYRWSYDALGRQMTETDPQGRSRSVAYNADGLVSGATDRRGMSVTALYDAEHRVTRRTADGKNTTYTYSRNPGRVVAVSEFSTDTLQEVSLTADGWMNRAVHVLGGRRYDVRNFSDAATGMPSRLMVTAFTGGTQAWQHSAFRTQDFTPSNPVYGFESGTGNFAGTSVTMSYLKEGGLSRTTYPNGVQRYHSYDHHRRPTGISFNSYPLTSFMGAEYWYEYQGRLASRGAMPGDTARLYGYDRLGRLKELSTVRYSIVPHPGCDPSQSSTCGRDTVATPLHSEAFAYDAVGNRTDHAGAVAPSSNRYTTFDGWTLAYDDEGNLISKSKPGMPTQTFTWNALGQLASVTTNGQTTQYGYNGFGTRVRRLNAQTGALVWYLYNGGNLLMEVDGAANPIRSYSHGAGIDNPLSVTVGNPATGQTYYYVSEDPGHVRVLLTSTGGFASKYVYGAFGDRRDGTSEGVQQPLQFMGRERDELTGIYYVRARWYDADLGRFVSEDPIGLSGGINTYAYANNDPINLRDPSGLSPDCGDGFRPGMLADGSEGCVLKDLFVNALDWSGYLREYDTGDYTRLHSRPLSQEMLDRLDRLARLSPAGLEAYGRSLQRLEELRPKQCLAGMTEATEQAWNDADLAAATIASTYAGAVLKNPALALEAVTLAKIGFVYGAIRTTVVPAFNKWGMPAICASAPGFYGY